MGGHTFRGDCQWADTMSYYGDQLSALTLENPLKASGKISFLRGVTDSTVLIGFFHSTDSIIVNSEPNSGSPPNFLGIAIEGPSREGFYFYPIYRNSGDGQNNSRGETEPPHIYPNGDIHEWTLEYSPTNLGGMGRITVTLDGNSVNLNFNSGDKDFGANFDRFGMITTHIDGNGQTIYFDELEYTNQKPLPTFTPTMTPSPTRTSTPTATRTNTPSPTVTSTPPPTESNSFSGWVVN